MKDKARKRVLVLFGGESCEHDISVITGVLTLNCMDGEKFLPVPVYVTKEGWFTGEELFDLGFFKKRDTERLERLVPVFKERTLYTLKGNRLKGLGETYCAINCCHGLNGEDGSLAGVMRLLGVPFASPDMLTSAVCMDKAATKTFLDGMGVRTLPCRVITSSAFYRNREMALDLSERKIGYPCIVKPARLGSSIGISRAACREELVAAIEFALRFDGKIIIERALDGFVEINCAAYRAKGQINVSECERPIASGELLSFEDKYKSGVKRGKTREFPARIAEDTAREIKEITGAVYRKLSAVGIVRMDFLVLGGEVYLNEVNTVPGSLALYLFRERTGEFGEVLTELIEEGVRAHREYENGCFNYQTDVLNCAGSKNLGSKRSTISR